MKKGQGAELVRWGGEKGPGHVGNSCVVLMVLSSLSVVVLCFI